MRAEVLARAKEQLYGSVPGPPDRVSVKVLSMRDVMEGKATETLLILIVHHQERQVPVRVGLVRPKQPEPVRVIIKNDRWLFDLSAMPPGRKKDQYASQGRAETFAKVREVAMDHGYAVCKFVREACYGIGLADVVNHAAHCRASRSRRASDSANLSAC